MIDRVHFENFKSLQDVTLHLGRLMALVGPIVVLARDLDGYPNRRAGLEQVCTGLSWPFAIVAATPEPEIEGWIVSGFVPRNEGEQRSLEQLRHELSSTRRSSRIV
jgi:hypothetical protein